jgi:beta-glucanase (GH16 family)
MRTVLFLSLFLLPLLSFGQGLLVNDDFEGNGTIDAWLPVDVAMDAPYPNPYMQAGNPSANVLRYIDYGAPFTNVYFDVPINFNLSIHHTFTVKVYVPSSSISGSQPNEVTLKLQNGTYLTPWTTQTAIHKPIVLDQWQEITFDFATDPFVNADPNFPDPVDRTDLNRVLLQVNGDNNSDEVIAYFDDFNYDGELNNPGGNDPVYDELVFFDEFDGSGAIDPVKWYHQTILPAGDSWFNGEIQHYTDRVDNAYQQNGYLYIMAKKETYNDQGVTKNYTSARLNSKFAFTYGKVEVRAKLPAGVGTWPAIWMLGQNISEPGGVFYDEYGTTPWPDCGEIDIMEHWGVNQNYISSALHTPCSFGNTVNVGATWGTDVSNTFHTYAVEWFPDRMEFSMDGDVFYIFDPIDQDPCTWPFDAPQYILLNVAILPTIDPAFTQSPMVIDWVRVYQDEPLTRAEAPTPSMDGLEVFPNPSDGNFTVRLPEPLKDATLRLTDTKGQLVWEEQVAELSNWENQTNLAPGIYWLSVEAAGGRWIERIHIQ